MKNDEKKYENKRRTSCICIIFKYMDQSTFLLSSTRVFYTSFAISTWRSVRAYANSIIVPLLSCFRFISYSFVLFFIFPFVSILVRFLLLLLLIYRTDRRWLKRSSWNLVKRSRTISDWIPPYDERRLRVPFHHVAVQSVQNRSISRANENNTHRFV